MNEYIEEAIEIFRSEAIRYAKTERYYRGDHDLSFATEKFQTAFGALFREFALNLCPAICDSVNDTLKVSGFGIAGIGGDDSVDAKPSAAKLKRDVEKIWHANRMAIRAGEIHLEALKNGDAYAIVWPGTDGNVIIYPQRATACTAVYDEEIPGSIRWAAKYWRARDKRIRLNLLFPDRIEKFVSTSRSEGFLPTAKEFVPLVEETTRHENAGKIRNPQSAIPNPYGFVPLFHFANNSEVGAFGKSELLQAIPIQNGLNKAVLDMLVAMEYSAYRQRWVAGIEVELDESGKPKPLFSAGLDHVWVAPDPGSRFGDFGTTDLEQFLKVKDSFRVDMASVTGTPLHYFLQSIRGFASGEALKRAEARFLAKVRDRQENFGQTWADLMSFALRVAGRGRGIELLTNWEDPAPMAEREFLENILLKKKIGVPVKQALKEAGYGDADIRQMLKAQTPQ